MSFHDLATTAAIGTGQRPFRTDQVPAALQALIDPEAEPARQVLDVAAGWEVVRRAEVRAGEQPVLIDEAGESRPEPPASLVALLRRILELKDGDRVLAETCSALAAAGLRLPHRLLIPVLERTRRSEVLSAAAQPVLGARGDWLQAALPRLKRSVSEPQAKDWDGTASLRVRWLKHLNHTDPAAAVDLLTADWAKESVDNREAFLTVFEEEPDPAQIEFLEQALADRSERVTWVARRALLSLPSPWRQRMIGYAAGLKLDDGALVLADPPSGKQATRDGATGPGAAAQIIAAVPPASWQQLIGLTALSILELCGEDSSTVIGLGRAAATYRDGQVAAAVLPRMEKLWEPPLARRLLELVDVPSRLVIAERADSVVLALAALEALPAPWPQQVVDLALRRLEQWRPTYPAEAITACTVMEQAVSPWLAAAAVRRINPESCHKKDPVRQVTRLITVLTLRAAVADEIRPYLNQENR
ncbi:MAG: DUF5691 domain-containing protein [Propionicimonas sp.]